MHDIQIDNSERRILLKLVNAEIKLIGSRPKVSVKRLTDLYEIRKLLKIQGDVGFKPE